MRDTLTDIDIAVLTAAHELVDRGYVSFTLKLLGRAGFYREDVLDDQPLPDLRLLGSVGRLEELGLLERRSQIRIYPRQGSTPPNLYGIPKKSTG